MQPVRSLQPVWSLQPAWDLEGDQSAGVYLSACFVVAHCACFRGLGGRVVSQTGHVAKQTQTRSPSLLHRQPLAPPVCPGAAPKCGPARSRARAHARTHERLSHTLRAGQH